MSRLNQKTSAGSPAIRRLELPNIGAIATGDPSSPALLCLHGWGGSRDIWRRFLELYGPSRYIVSLDMPGTRGTRPLDDWNHREFAAWVLRSADALGIERFALMGHSMGGNTAAHVAALAPERIERLVLVNAAVYSDQLHSTRAYVGPKHGQMVVELARLGSGFLGVLSRLFPESESGGMWRPWLRRCGYFYRHNSVEALHNQLRAMVESPFDPRTLPPNLPVLVFHGELDTVVPVAQAHQIWKELGERPGEGGADNARLIVYAKAQHVPMDTNPHDFVKDVREFLEGGNG